MIPARKRVNMYSRDSILIRVWFVLTLSLLFSGLGFAEGIDYEVRVGAIYSDNIQRAEFGEESENIGMVGLKVDTEHQSRGYSAYLDADLEYRTYLNDSFDDENFSFLSAGARINVVPNFFSWNFENRFGKISRNPFAVETPATREDINVFSTGPLFTVPGNKLHGVLRPWLVDRSVTGMCGCFEGNFCSENDG